MPQCCSKPCPYFDATEFSDEIDDNSESNDDACEAGVEAPELNDDAGVIGDDTLESTGNTFNILFDILQLISDRMSVSSL